MRVRQVLPKHCDKMVQINHVLWRTPDPLRDAGIPTVLNPVVKMTNKLRTAGVLARIANGQCQYLKKTRTGLDRRARNFDEADFVVDRPSRQLLHP